MDIILHIGAHRTATTTFQSYLREQRAPLAGRGLAIWDPRQTRSGLFSGVLPDARGPSDMVQMRYAQHRVAHQLQREARAGAHMLLVSDENFAGTPALNLRRQRLYPEIDARVPRFVEAFGACESGHVSRVTLSVRPLDDYWTSLAALTVMRGHRVPGAQMLSAIAGGGATHGWRALVERLAHVLPGTEILVMPHDGFAARPDLRLRAMTGLEGIPRGTDEGVLNPSPDLPRLRKLARLKGGQPEALPSEGRGRWMPFSPDARAALREVYEDDLYWLRGGAGGLARWVEPEDRVEGQAHAPADGEMKAAAQAAHDSTADGATRTARDEERGRHHGIEERRLA